MNKRAVTLVAVTAVVSAVAAVGIPLLIIVALLGAASQNSCDSGGAAGPGGPVTVPAAAAAAFPQLSAVQLHNAAAVVSAGRRLGVSEQGVVVALATASQESGFKNYANDGRGGDLASDQWGISRSLALPHEAVGSDHGSLGIFQQQWPWWGTMQQLMVPASSAARFYAALLRVPGGSSCR